MISRWTLHLETEEEKEKFKKEILGSKNVLDRLMNILEEDEKGLNRSEIDPKSYSTPNWDYKQAHKNGMRQYMAQIKALIDLDQQKGK